MIKNTTARAIQISTMEPWQLEQLHTKENKIGYYLPNWNIQKLLHLKSIKETYGIPDDDLFAHSDYSNRIEGEIDTAGFLSMTEGAETSLEWLHAYDWAVINNKEKINWEYSKGKKGGLLQRLSKAIPAIFLLLAK